MSGEKESRADVVREREAKRKEATRRMWADNEKRWKELYGRPIGGRKKR